MATGRDGGRRRRYGAIVAAALVCAVATALVLWSLSGPGTTSGTGEGDAAVAGTATARDAHRGRAAKPAPDAGARADARGAHPATAAAPPAVADALQGGPFTGTVRVSVPSRTRDGASDVSGAGAAGDAAGGAASPAWDRPRSGRADRPGRRAAASGSGRAAGTAAEDGVVTVVVHADETHGPLAGAVVTFLAGSREPESEATDPTGTIVRRFPGGTSLEVRAKAPGRVILRAQDVLVPQADEVRVEFSLVRGVLVRGVVTAGAATPVAGARVRVFDFDAWKRIDPWGAEPFPFVDVSADRHGVYVADALPRSTRCVGIVEAPGRATEVESLPPEPEAGIVLRHDIETMRESAVSGRVLDAAGDPAEGATVLAFVPVDVAEARKGHWKLLTSFTDDEIEETALLDHAAWFRLAASPWSRATWIRWCRARTDEGGAFRLGGLPAGAQVRLLACDPSRGHSVPSDVLRNGGSADLALRGKVAVTFRIGTKKGDTPLEPRAAPMWPWDAWAASQLGPGLLGTPRLDVGVGHVLAAAKDRLSWHYGVIVPPSPSGSATIAFPLRDGLTLRGNVTDDRAVPVEGAEATDSVTTVTTAADGSYVFDDLDAEVGPSLSFRKTGHLGAVRAFTDARAGVLDARLDREAAATLRIVPPDAAPAWRRIAWSSGARDGRWTWGQRDDLAWGDGVVRIVGLARGDVVVQVLAPGTVAAVARGVARPGETTDLGELRLVPARHMEGTVRDASGIPVAGADAFLDPRSSDMVATFARTRVATTDAEGRFTLEVPFQSSVGVTVSVRAPGVGWGSVPLPAPDAAPPTIVLQPYLTLRGRVVGAAVPGAFVEWDKGFRRAIATSEIAADGTFEGVFAERPTSLRVTGPDGKTLAWVPVPQDATSATEILVTPLR